MILPRPGFRATPDTGGLNRLVLLAMATFLAVNLSLACDDERTETIDAAQEDNPTATIDFSQALKDTDISEGSRTLGGVPVKPFPWLINLWSAGPPPNKNYDGRYAGLGMRIKNDTFLAADASCHAVERYAWDYGMTEVFELRAPEKINVREGPDHGWYRRLGCSHYLTLGTRSGFGVYQMKFHSGRKLESFISIRDIKDGVPFQNDSKVEKDCYLYAYSANLDVNKEPLPVRVFSKHPVKLISCGQHDNGYCKFEFPREAGARVGFNCPRVGDAGAPVICGGKVSFVLDEKKGDNCTSSFSALKLAPHFNELKPPPDARYYGIDDDHWFPHKKLDKNHKK